MILNRAVQMIDNDMPTGGAAGAQQLQDLLDVDVTNALTGYALFVKLIGNGKGKLSHRAELRRRTPDLPQRTVLQS